MNQKTNQPQSDIDLDISSQRAKKLGCYVLAIVAVAGYVFISPFLPSFSGGGGKRYIAANHDAGMACTMAQKLIKDQLKSPTSAKFDYSDCRDNATQSGNIWTLRSYVDADNIYGANLRSHYVAKLRNVPPSDTWRLVELTFDEP